MSTLPWCEQSPAPETGMISSNLKLLNANGYLTINSQVRSHLTRQQHHQQASPTSALPSLPHPVDSAAVRGLAAGGGRPSFE